jgi:hypothetical protein
MLVGSQLMEYPPGDSDQWHAVLAEAYDLNEDCTWAQNSWGHENGTQDRFKFRWEAFHDYHYIKVFWTLDSIRGKTCGIYQPRLEKFVGRLDGLPIDCAYMDEQTLRYEQEFVFARDPDLPPPLNFLGYDLDQYLDIRMNCAKTAG